MSCRLRWSLWDAGTGRICCRAESIRRSGCSKKPPRRPPATPPSLQDLLPVTLGDWERRVRIQQSSALRYVEAMHQSKACLPQLAEARFESAYQKSQTARTSSPKPLTVAVSVNAVWSMDFLHDQFKTVAAFACSTLSTPPIDGHCTSKPSSGFPSRELYAHSRGTSGRAEGRWQQLQLDLPPYSRMRGSGDVSTGDRYCRVGLRS
jgi:hypothetical protein